MSFSGIKSSILTIRACSFLCVPGVSFLAMLFVIVLTFESLHLRMKTV